MTSTADTSTAPKGERPADAIRHPSEWESIDWRKAEAQVGRMQERISKAYGEGVSPCEPPSETGLLSARAV